MSTPDELARASWWTHTYRYHNEAFTHVDEEFITLECALGLQRWSMRTCIVSSVVYMREQKPPKDETTLSERNWIKEP